MVHILVGWVDSDAGQQGPAVRSARVIQESDYGRQVQGGIVLVRMKLEAALRELITGDGISKLRWLLQSEWQPSVETPVSGPAAESALAGSTKPIEAEVTRSVVTGSTIGSPAQAAEPASPAQDSGSAGEPG